MVDSEFDIHPDDPLGLSEGKGTIAEPRTSPGELSCPVCDRVIQSPAPETCPFCQSPIHSINALLRTADLSVNEALRDLNAGFIESASRRLNLIRVTSRRHRLKVEILHAMIDRLNGKPSDTLARIRAIREKIAGMDDFDDNEVVNLMDDVEVKALADQRALASCCEHYNFALFQAKRGNLEQAKLSLNKALEDVPFHAPTHALLGKVLLALGERDDARYHLRRALSTDPSNNTATRLLSAMGEKVYTNPMDYLRLLVNLPPAWTGSIIVIIILAVIALAALLSN